MENTLLILLAVAMGLVVIVLFAGIVSFAFGNRTDRLFGTRMMSARVALQGVAIALFALIMLMGGQ